MTDDLRPEIVEPPTPECDPERFGDLPAPEPGDLIPSLSPRQVLGGFVLLAAAVVVLRRLGRPRTGPRG